tara:strand:- start:1124 stop:2770 length:1647 start_codon:yes stop_codon:yes gene_type:complete
MAIFTGNTASAQLKSYFETGDVPTANNFIDLIDSFAVYDGTLPFISGSSIGTGSFGNLVVAGNINSNLIPTITKNYNLGSTNFVWNNVFVNSITGSGTAGGASVTASVHLVPGRNNIYDLGSPSLEWKDLYINGIAYIDSASITNTDISKVNSDLIPTVTNLKDLGSSTLEWKDAYIDGVAYIDKIDKSNDAFITITTASVAYFSSSLIPGTDDAFDLGASGKEWKDLYVDGTAYIDTISLSNLTTGHITASNVELAGSASITEGLTVNGNTVFGNAGTDLHTFTGNVTASGAISSSEGISAEAFSANNQVIATYRSADTTGAQVRLGANAKTMKLYGTNFTFGGPITGSVVSASSAFIGSASFVNMDTTTVSSNLNPTVTNFKDLGSSTLQWKDLYVDGKAYIDEISGSGAAGDSALTASVNIVPGVDNTYSLGSTGLEWKDLFIDGTANLDTAVVGALTVSSVGSNIEPTTTNTYKLGSSTKKFTEANFTSQSLSVSASLSAIKFENLPTNVHQAKQIGVGALFLSGSENANEGGSGSKALHIYVG